MEDDLMEEPRVRRQGRLAARRLLAFIGAIFLGLLIFSSGVLMGIKMERKRSAALKEASPLQVEVEGALKEAKSASQKVEEGKVPLTFYETLTKEEKGPKVTEEKGEKGKAAPKEAKKGEKAPEVKPPPRDLYFVQVASFRQKANAQSLMRRLKEKGYEVRIVQVTLGKGKKWWRVKVGGFAERGEAERVKGALEKEGFEGIKVTKGL